MITKQDLAEAIAECQGQRNPNANTAVKLAAFYTILDHMGGDAIPEPVPPYAPVSVPSGRSFASSSVEKKDMPGVIKYAGSSDFSFAVNGKPEGQVLAVFEELMDTIQIMNQRLYDSVMRKLSDIGASD